MNDILALEKTRDFLRSTWLCSESLSDSTLNRLAKIVTPQSHSAGLPIENKDALTIIKQGSVELTSPSGAITRLHEGDFFGEEGEVLPALKPFTAMAATACELMRIPAGVVRDIPALRWKLFETYERRLHVL